MQASYARLGNESSQALGACGLCETIPRKPIRCSKDVCFYQNRTIQIDEALDTGDEEVWLAPPHRKPGLDRVNSTPKIDETMPPRGRLDVFGLQTKLCDALPLIGSSRCAFRGCSVPVAWERFEYDVAIQRESTTCC